MGDLAVLAGLHQGVGSVQGRGKIRIFGRAYRVGRCDMAMMPTGPSWVAP